MIDCQTHGVGDAYRFIGERLSLFRNWFTRLRVLMVAVLLMSLTPLYARDRTIRVGVVVDNYPFSFRDSVGKMDGFAYDLLKEIELTMGLRFERVEGTTEEINKAFREHRLDLLQSYARSAQRDSTTAFSVPYSTMLGQIFVRDKIRSVKSLEDLKGLRVLVHQGSVGDQILKKAGLDSSITFDRPFIG